MRAWIRMLWLIAAMMASVDALAQSLDDLLLPEAVSESTAQQATIDVGNDAASDEAILDKLQGIYTEFEALSEVIVKVNHGIVTLSGSVASAQAAERAVALGSQVEGVIEVVDELTVDTDVNQRVQSTLATLQHYLLSTLGALPVLLLAVVVVFIFWWAGRRAGQHRRLFLMVAPNGFIAELLATLVRILVTIAGLILALSLLDATSVIGSLLGAAGIIGLAVGFAVRDTVENFIASVLLSLRSPFLARDYVRIGEHEGTVARLTSRATILISRDGNHVRVPNATVYKAVIVNYTRQPERRLEFRIGVGTDVDLEAARQLGMETMNAVDGVLSAPTPMVLVEELAESNVTLVISAWADQTVSDLLKVRSEAIRLIKQAFDSAGFDMPEPTYRVALRGQFAETPLSQWADKPRAGGASASEDHADAPRAQGDDPAPQLPSSATTTTGDTSADDVIVQKVDRELAESGERNLLTENSRQE